jgi:hypothetical protein
MLRKPIARMRAKVASSVAAEMTTGPPATAAAIWDLGIIAPSML